MNADQFKTFLKSMNGLGVPNDEIFGLLKISRRTLYNWRKRGMSEAYDASCEAALTKAADTEREAYLAEKELRK